MPCPRELGFAIVEGGYTSVLLRKGIPWSTVMKSTGAARGTVAKPAKRLAEGAPFVPI
jgi:hypothetical protein